MFNYYQSAPSIPPPHNTTGRALRPTTTPSFAQLHGQGRGRRLHRLVGGRAIERACRPSPAPFLGHKGVAGDWAVCRHATAYMGYDTINFHRERLAAGYFASPRCCRSTIATIVTHIDIISIQESICFKSFVIQTGLWIGKTFRKYYLENII